MKCTIPEISWHNRDPVLSVDIQPKVNNVNEKNDFYRLASGGTDSHVLIWHLKKVEETGSVSLDVVSDLTRHQRAVNCVRWSPSGEFLASGDDESVIYIWKLKSESEIINIVDDTNEADKETWITLKILRGHMEDVYDLSWSPNSLNLISGSVDNTAIVWDVQKGKSMAILSDHKGFVQGVSWDPQNQYLATLSTDRYFRIFDITSKKVVSRNSKCLLPVPEDSPYHGKTVRLFHDDTLQTFFRRLSFSPDGEIIITPSGVTEIDNVPKPLHTTYIYTRYSLKQPSVILPSPDQYTVAVRFCPLLFELRPHLETNPPVIPLPYRMVFAVATKNCVYLYDTQQKSPFGLISNIHYTRLTDMAWSDDGQLLIVSSTDGFCSIIVFNKNEIGNEYKSKDEEVKADGIKSASTTPEKMAVSTPVEIISKPKEKVLDLKPNPIEIRRKPRNMDDKPTQIEVRRKPKEVADTYEKDTEVVFTSSKNESTTTTKTPEKTITLPPIISSDEKFESPEKIDRPVTPIAVRRYPRNSTSSTPTDNENSPQLTTKTDKFKKATPIAIRRKPKNSTNLIEKESKSKEPRIDEDEAIDAWPIGEDKPVTTVPKTNIVEPMEIETTSDIRLVYEGDETIGDTTKENNLSKPETPVANQTFSDSIQNNLNKTPKTPRRVDFKTISTPKSKKKLL